MKADQMKTARPGGVRLRTPVWLTLATALALSGCATHSAYEQPTVQVPGAWQQGQGLVRQELECTSAAPQS